MQYITGASKSDAMTEREKRNRKIAYEAALEGIVLLENKNHVLPLTEKKIALYGAGAVETVKGGTGSGEVNERYSVNILEGLRNAGFEITTMDWLEDYVRTYEAEARAYKERAQKTSLLKFKDVINIMSDPMQFPYGRKITETDIKKSATDTAIYVVARQAGEGNDKKLDRGEFVLSQVEKDNLRMIAGAYEKTILVINSGAQMDLSILDEISMDAVIYFCQQGMEGGNALADILSGSKTPSGRLVDTWVNKYEDIPFAKEYSYLSGDTTKEEYKEGIFVGYRYFDTYDVSSRYCFGQGLSYTTFSILPLDFKREESTFMAKVKVTNTGKYSGKEVVQAYVRLPQTNLPKEKRRLAAFAKTGELAPGQSQELSLVFEIRDLTSYDERQAAYIMEAGQYVVSVGEDLQNQQDMAVVSVTEDIQYKKVKHACAVSEKVCRMPEAKLPSYEVAAGLLELQLSQQDVKTEETIYKTPDIYHDKEVDAVMQQLNTADMIEICVGSGISGMLNGKGVACPGAIGRTTDALYKKGLLNVNLSDGPAGLRILRTSAITKKGKVKMKDYIMSIMEFLPKFMLKGMTIDEKKDQLLYQYTTAFPVGTALAQSYNVDLLEKIGQAISEEMEEYYITYWLAPALNIHRNPLCGRNFEYFSEDPLVSGKMAAALTRGVQSIEGNYATIKHFAANNQEDNRNRSNSIVDERALREIYLRGFEIAVEESHPKAVMSSYNLLNGVYTSNRKDLLTDILRNEWGFDGVVMSDWFATGQGLADDAKAIIAGNDLIMPGGGGNKKALKKALKAGTLTEEDLRRATANIVRQIVHSSVAKKARCEDFIG